jgi:hypothetical protein
MAADTWGLSWGGSTGAWLASWAREFVPPVEPETPAVTPAGSSRKRRRHYVEIDGQQFDVADANEALQLLERARALAEVAAESKAKKVEAKAARATKPRPIRIQAPKITASPELELDLAPIRRDIARIYDSAAATAELRLLLLRAIEEDEEEAILLLM